MQRVPYTFPLHKLPPELRFLQRSFLFFLPFQLDKIKVGGDSCLPRHFDKKSVHRITELATLLGIISIKRGYLKSLGFTLNVFYCLLCLFYFSRAFWELTDGRILFPDSRTLKIRSGIVIRTSFTYVGDESV